MQKTITSHVINHHIYFLESLTNWDIGNPLFWTLILNSTEIKDSINNALQYFCTEKKGFTFASVKIKGIYKASCHKATTQPGRWPWIQDPDDMQAFQSQDCYPPPLKAMTRRPDSKTWLFNNGSIHMPHKVCHWLTAAHQNHMRFRDVPRWVKGGRGEAEQTRSWLVVYNGARKMNKTATNKHNKESGGSLPGGGAWGNTSA